MSQKTIAAKLTDQQILNALAIFQLNPSVTQLGQIREYVYLLCKWNKILSLTSILNPIEIVAKHFGESMFACSLLPVENGRLADVGTGAGFPGLALKIMAPSLQVDLIESNTKKCAFLSEIIRTIGVTDVNVLPVRFEDMPLEREAYNYVTARALGGFSELLRWAEAILAPRGHLLLWLGGEDVSKISTREEWLWQPAAHLPDSQRRFILIGRPRVQ
jgi:16S rRNA (guanine527-N7)-methyltransferase